MSDFWQGKKVVVTGGHGFLGRRLVGKLVELGSNVSIPRRFLQEEEPTLRYFESICPDICFHLAASVGGIGANLEFPAMFFIDNMRMGLNVIDSCLKAGVKKLVTVGTTCSYPKHAPIPFREEYLWTGYPEETNAPYGIAKLALLTMCQAYRAQYGFNVVYLVPANLYGPGDNFDPKTSHVIPALIRRFFEARASGKVTLWGTGAATRSFLYVDDCADGLILAAEKYNGPEPVNLGAGDEISILDLAYKIAGLCGYSGGIYFDREMPDGQPRRRLDTSKAKEIFGFKASTSFDDGLKKTVEWYQAQRVMA